MIETSRPIAEVARDLGINEGTLGHWVTKYRNEHPPSEELTITERAKLKELEKENRELRMERDFLKTGSSGDGYGAVKRVRGGCDRFLAESGWLVWSCPPG